MRSVLNKAVMVLGAAVAVCSFALPSPASAASWAVVGSAHVLTATNLGFTVHAPAGQVGWLCTDVRLTTDVRSAAVLTITGAEFFGCNGSGLGTGCTVTPTGTNFHWTATGITTANVQVHGIDIDVRYETRPPAGSTPCPLTNTDFRMTGTLSGGTWGAITRSLTIGHGTLLTHSAALGTGPTTVNDAIFIDLVQTLTLT
jgi:hypothetical protein